MAAQAGNRTSVNGGNLSTYDADDELKTVGGGTAFALTYNANGDRTTEAVSGQVTTFTYDFDDRLTGITAGGTSTSYSYDALGRQVNRTVNGATTGFYPDGDRSLVEKGPTGTTQYTWGNGLIRVNGEYPLTDGRGDVRLTTNGSKQVTSSNTPDAFGVGSSTANTASPFQWNAGAGYRTENLAPLGLSYAYSLQKVGDRYYDPALGCFLTRDTALGEKPYAYCDGDPVNFSDPSGHIVTAQTLAHAALISQCEEKPGQGMIDTGGHIQSGANVVLGGAAAAALRGDPADMGLAKALGLLGAGLGALGGLYDLIGLGMNDGWFNTGPPEPIPHSPPMQHTQDGGRLPTDGAGGTGHPFEQ